MALEDGTLGFSDREATSQSFKPLGDLRGCRRVFICVQQQRTAKGTDLIGCFATSCEPLCVRANRAWLIGGEIDVGFDFRELRLRLRSQCGSRTFIRGHQGGEPTQECGNCRIDALADADRPEIGKDQIGDDVAEQDADNAIARGGKVEGR